VSIWLNLLEACGIYVTTGMSLSYRYACFIDGALRHWGWGGGAFGGRLEPYTALYRNNERGGKGSEEKNKLAFSGGGN